MKVYSRFRSWCSKKSNRPLRRLLGIAVVAGVYLIAGFGPAAVSFILWMILTR